MPMKRVVNPRGIEEIAMLTITRWADEDRGSQCAPCRGSSCSAACACSGGRISWAAGGWRSRSQSRCRRSRSLAATSAPAAGLGAACGGPGMPAGMDVPHETATLVHSSKRRTQASCG